MPGVHAWWDKCCAFFFTCSLLTEGIFFIFSTLCGYCHIIESPRNKGVEGAFAGGFCSGESLKGLSIMR